VEKLGIDQRIQNAKPNLERFTKVRQKRARYSPAPKKDNAKQKSAKQVCKFYQDTGKCKCKLGAKCKFAHDQHNGSNLKRLNRHSSLLASNRSKFEFRQKQFQKSTNDIDRIVNQFLMVRTIPRECSSDSIVDVSCLSTVLVDMSSFAFDTGSEEGVSVHRKDFVDAS
jgi:hypothetical protein